MPTKQEQRIPKILIIDNYDSYTFNLYQYFSQYEPIVIRNNQFEWQHFKSEILPYLDAIVISPGPGRPDCTEDFGICSKVLLEANIPLLGVCLGHQGLASVLGGQVISANPPMHGRLSDVYHDGKDLFKSVPSPFPAVRYHSLVVSAENLPKELEICAWSNGILDQEPIIMGLKHKSRPIWTVQFHPESICTGFGRDIVNNFCEIVTDIWSKKNVGESVFVSNINVIPVPLVMPSKPKMKHFQVILEQLDQYVDPELLFQSCFSQSTDSIWLDSSRIENRLSRYAFMTGGEKGPEGFKLEFFLGSRKIIETNHEKSTEKILDSSETFFAHLANIMHDSKIEVQNIEWKAESEIPSIPFLGGLVGYIGYEMKSETLKYSDAQAPFLSKSAGSIPDCSFIFTDRLVIFDYQCSKIYLACLINESVSDMSARKLQLSWIQNMKQNIDKLSYNKEVQMTIFSDTPVKKLSQLKMAHEKNAYVEMIETSLDYIKQGETYEVCLTTQLECQLSKPHPHPFEMYKHLRKRNPAPYSSYLAFGDLIITSSSPERFLRVESNGYISMKPIKGTVKVANPLNFKGTTEEIETENERRALDLATSEKNRSENLMIVDLIRNDLNQISELDTVQVPHLMVVESYATVHQLVSTVVASLRPDMTAVDALMRSFPPGSMTGAPKLRTVQIIEKLEQIPRGVYSGVIGYFSVCGKSDFSVVIRTAVFDQKGETTKVSVGAGGAIVALSDPIDEFDEMVLKAQSVLPSLDKTYQGFFC